jgi:hypothetical protein
VISRRAAVSGFLGVVFVFVLAFASPSGAEQWLRIFGTVQWIASTQMQVMTVAGTSIAVDLTRADQSSYHALHTGQAVVVDGVVSADRRRIVARTIWRDEGGYESP